MSSFFDRFFSFVPAQSKSLEHDFERLRIDEGWDKIEAKDQRKLCILAEYQHHFHPDGFQLNGKLEIWQRLCDIVGAERGASITQCKKILKKTFVNIIDLIDAMRTGTQPRVFKNRYALVKYTKKNKKIFPRTLAKQDGYINVFLTRLS